MENKQIVFTAINKAELLTVELPPLKENEVRIQTAISCISNGTERANITGDPNVSVNSSGQVKFPRTTGYSNAGTVLEVGDQVTGFVPGDRVVMSWSKHITLNTLPEEKLSKIPDTVSFEEAAWVHIATFPLAALRKTHLELGESFLVMGLGILGLIAVQLAKAAGACPVIAADPNPARREKALKFGADYALDPTLPDFAEQVKALSGGINAAIEVTGIGGALDTTLDCMARYGRVALLGCTRDRNFTIDYYRKVHGPGITLIGAHTMARPKEDSSSGWFTERDDRESLLKLLAAGRLNFNDLTDETHRPEECSEVFERLVHDRDFPVAVQFDWRK